eukprot:gb/GEZN01002216.1/.p1 GENE.gb/GEZN01002216.1/~~gb/GEZN01002216.1/.p1  ORF type:complete len:499 (-),score=63.75 gb/GEZN01002216.1/:923-2419(-)
MIKSLWSRRGNQAATKESCLMDVEQMSPRGQTSSLNLKTAQPSSLKTLTLPLHEGRGRILQVLKKSLFGAVVLAVDETQPDHKFVIKMSNRNHSEGRNNNGQCQVVENVLMEALLWKRVQDAGRTPLAIEYPGFRYICKLERFAANSENYLTVMEHCEGGDLFDKLERSGPFAPHLAQHVFTQLLLGVQSIHAAGVCHMDLSLENVLLNAEGEIRICDFGVARRILPVDRITGGTRPGKNRYMAPEVYAYEEFDGRKADMWSLGVMLFVILTGLQPFINPSSKDQVYLIVLEGGLKRVLKSWGFTWDMPSLPSAPVASISSMSPLSCPASPSSSNTCLSSSFASVSSLSTIPTLSPSGSVYSISMSASTAEIMPESESKANLSQSVAHISPVTPSSHHSRSASSPSSFTLHTPAECEESVTTRSEYVQEKEESSEPAKQSLPAGAVDLLYKLLQPQSTRYTMAETLAHPWIASRLRAVLARQARTARTLHITVSTTYE